MRYKFLYPSCLFSISDSVLRNGTLMINKSIAKDEGQYLCQAKNGVGEGISKLAEVTINGKNS